MAEILPVVPYMSPGEVGSSASERNEICTSHLVALPLPSSLLGRSCFSFLPLQFIAEDTKSLHPLGLVALPLTGGWTPGHVPVEVTGVASWPHIRSPRMCLRVTFSFMGGFRHGQPGPFLLACRVMFLVAPDGHCLHPPPLGGCPTMTSTCVVPSPFISWNTFRTETSSSQLFDCP